MSKEYLKFPKGFLWGSSVSSYQVEGGIENSDWSEKFPAGKACDYYNRYEQYFDMAKELNQNVHRFSIEWSRIQPEEGKFDRKEVEHYKNILKSLKKRKIKSMVTLWHYTLPLWMSKKGGWKNTKSPEYFESYTRFVAEEFNGLVDFWVTLNEPLIYMCLAYIAGRFPPQEKKILLTPVIFLNFARAHKKAYKTIHEINAKAKVGIAENYPFFDAYSKESFLNNAVTYLRDFFNNHFFLKITLSYMDFIGINYYFHSRIRITPFSLPFIKVSNENKEISETGWEIFPIGIYYVLKSMKKYNLPIYITENGIADSKDKKRFKFIAEHLKFIQAAIKEGVDVRGYMYWSLLDNFEWESGFDKRFGLIEINYKKNLEAKIRPSAYKYAKICKDNSILKTY